MSAVMSAELPYYPRPNAAPKSLPSLTEGAFSRLISNLTNYGSRLDAMTDGGRRHREALRAILEQYTELAEGRATGRHVFPLPTAMGKTQSVVAWCAEVCARRLPHTVVICQEQIASLCALYHDLVREIPADRIGIIHTDRAAEVSCSEGEPEQYQILLMTHAMVRCADDLERFTHVDGRARDLVVWDEALLKSEGRHQQRNQLDASLAFAARIAELEAAPKDVTEAAGYVGRALATIAERAHNGEAFELERLDGDTLRRYEGAVREFNFGRVGQEVKAEILRFLANSQEPVRAIDNRFGDSGVGLISFVLRVPHSLRNVVVLDASATVRELLDHDATLNIRHDLETIKDCSRLHVEQVRVPSGNVRMRKLTAASAHVKQIVDDLTTGWLPRNEAVLVCAVKDHGKRSALDTIKAALVKAGVDLDQTVNVFEYSPELRRMIHRRLPRYVFLTWGRERSTNDYRHCSRIIACGVLRRDPLELSATVAGQREDLEHGDVTHRATLEAVGASEQFVCLHQLLGRGTARKVRNGIGGECRVRVYDQTDFTRFLGALPGVEWKVLPRLTHVVGQKDAPKATQIAGRIVRHMRAFEGSALSVRRLKAELNAGRVPANSFTRALDLALLDLPQWQRQGRTLVAVTS